MSVVVRVAMVPHIPHPPSLAPLLLLSVTLLISHVTGQGVNNNEVTGHGPEDSLEETVIAEILRTVDQKFDSLSARISGLERSVNSLNFYSVRQFRDISDSLESSTAAMDSLRTQLTKVDKDNRALKVAVTQTSRSLNAIRSDVGAVKSDVKVVKSEVGTTKEEVEALKSDSLKMFEDIANSIVYFNENVGERSEELKASLTQTVSLAEERQASERQEDSAVILSYLHDFDLHAPRNCNVNFGPLEERIDLRFAEMKRQTHIHFVDLINAAPHRHDDEEKEEEEDRDQDRQKQSPPVSEAPGPLRPVSQAGAEGAAAVGEEGGGGGGGGGDGERVMRLLANMTQNVMEAVSFLRHSGSMMERLLHASLTIKDEQSRLRQELEAGRLLSSGQGAEMSLDSLVSNLPQGGPLPSLPHLLPPHLSARPQEVGSSSSNVLGEPVHRLPASGPLSEKTRPDGHHPHRFSSSSPLAGSRGGGGASPPPPSGGGVSMRGVAEESLQVLSELTRNGSQLLEVMTDLAQLSSNSLSLSLADLRDQVLRLQKLRNTLREDSNNPSPTAKPSSDLSVDAESSPEGGGELRILQNTTKTIFSIVEAIASNTGWIPYIFHNMQHVERLTNRTLQLTQRALTTHHRGPVRGRGGGEEGPWRGGGGGVGMDESQALQAMYRTSVQLQRILPALTKLVAEPEPLMALAEGRSSHEGRVEIFHRGHWGAVCRLDMGHAEASAVCQYLGFAGGVWAGAGHFEREIGGRHWILNVSCVFSQACPIVMPVNRSVDCPSGHFSVICDHMLRMTPIPGISDVKTGLVSIHHQGRWLPVCSHGWSGYEARVACKQMGFLDGREFLRDGMPWREVLGEVRSWVAGVGCTGEEGRLDACNVDTYSAEECSETNTPAAVRCQ